MSDRGRLVVSRDRQRVQPRLRARACASLAVALALAGVSGTAVALDDQTSAQTEQAIARAMELSSAFERVADTVSPAVVHITATTTPPNRGQARGGPQGQQPPRQPQGDPNDPFEPFRRMFPDQFRQMPDPGRSSTGSGVIVSKDGYILTNNHVVAGADSVEVSLGENQSKRFSAKVIGTDPATDLAVIKIEGDNFPFVELGDSDKLRIGEWVVAIGNPFDLNRTVTAGIVSAKGRVQRQGQLADVAFQDFIQTDAAINPGNSGGPLLNLRGQIVGINSAILSRSGGSVGIGFSIPANLARNVMEQLIASGKVERGFLGIVGQDVDDALAKTFSFTGTGVLINEIGPASPAEEAGLKVEDIVTKFNGRAVSSWEQFRNQIASTAPGKSIDLEIFRGGQTEKVSVTIGKRPTETVVQGDDPDTAISPGETGLGVTVRTVDEDIKRELRDRRASGVVVTEVEPGSLAARAGFRPGLVIQQIGTTEITSAADFRAALADADFKQPVRMVVRLNGVTQRIAVRSN
jgi:serine protease Do